MITVSEGNAIELAYTLAERTRVRALKQLLAGADAWSVSVPAGTTIAAIVDGQRSTVEFPHMLLRSMQEHTSLHVAIDRHLEELNAKLRDEFHLLVTP